MKPYQGDKTLVIIRGAAPTNGETITSDAIDCAGFRTLEISLYGSTSNNATNNPSTLKLTESNDLTTYTAMAAFTGDGVGGFTVPNSPTATSDMPFARFVVDLTKWRKRYKLLTITPVTTQTFVAIARLGRNEQLADSDTERNVAISVIG